LCVGMDKRPGFGASQINFSDCSWRLWALGIGAALPQPRGSPVVFPGAARFLKVLCIPDSAYSAYSARPRPRLPPPRARPAAYSVKKKESWGLAQIAERP
jgi:hypothetical protein